VSTVSEHPARAAEQPRPLLYRRVNQLLDEVARLSETDLEPAAYHRQFLQRVVSGTAAVAGAIWVSSPDGAVRSECELHLDQTGLADTDAGRQAHEDLLRDLFRNPRPVAYGPRGGPNRTVANPTDDPILLAPVTIEGKAVALVEVWLQPGTADVEAALGPFVVGMAHYASIYLRNRQLRTLTAQQQLWVQLEDFSRQLQASLDLAEVAYTAANEGCRLIAGDRLSVVRRRGGQAAVEAVSGAPVVERRSVQARLLAELSDTVLTWGERLVYRGAPDPSLPPDVLTALDAYLAASPARLLVVLPLGDAAEHAGPARFALVLEGFEPGMAPEPLLARLDVVGRHARGPLENAARYGRVPLRALWERFGQAREERGRRAGLGTLVVCLAGAILLAGVATLPCPLKVEATGQLLPVERRCLYAPVEGRVVRFEPAVQPGGLVVEDQPLVLMYDTQLELRLVQLRGEIAAAQEDLAAVAAQLNTARTEADRLSLVVEKKQKEFARDRKQAELKALRERTHAEETRPGYFWLKAPLGGTVLDWDFRERLTNRAVKPSEPLLRIGDKGRGWEVELRIPHRSVGPILEAFAAGAEELDVDLLLTSQPTRTFRGKLMRPRLAAAASRDHDADTPEPFVRASVRLDGPDIPAEQRLPQELLVTGTEVHAQVRCGDHPLVQSLFHGAWEWFYETVLFF
jgi:hypothetical protein